MGARRWGKAAHAALGALHPLQEQRGDHWQRPSPLRTRMSTRELFRRAPVDLEKPAAIHLGTVRSRHPPLRYFALRYASMCYGLVILMKLHTWAYMPQDLAETALVHELTDSLQRRVPESVTWSARQLYKNQTCRLMSQFRFVSETSSNGSENSKIRSVWQRRWPTTLT